MSGGGFIVVQRALFETGLWTSRERFDRRSAWLDLVRRASWRDHEVLIGSRVVLVRRGQVLTSQVALARDWRWDRETVGTFLRFLNASNLIRIETSKASSTGYTLVTIEEFDSYQAGASAVPASRPASDPASVPASTPQGLPHPSSTIEEVDPAPPAWGGPEALVELYNAAIPEGHPRMTRLTAGRRQKAKTYLQQFPERTFWAEVFAEIGKSRFLRGLEASNGHRGFRADLDWLLTKGKDGAENAIKVHEGKYRDGNPSGASDPRRINEAWAGRTTGEVRL